MFEFEDSKLGKIKVVNVTEARSAIASIMTDKEYNYVITKNNRPIRVIINFDIYKKSQLSAAKLAKTVESRNALKGLLQTRESDLKSQGSLRSEELISGRNPQPQAPVSQEGVVKGGAVEEEISEPIEETAPAVGEEIVSKAEAVSEPIEEVAIEHEPPPTDDYFQRFRKLYEMPRQKPLLGGQPVPDKRGSLGAAENRRAVAIPVAESRPAIRETVEESHFEDLPEPPEESWAERPVDPSGPGHSGSSDFPSIQDLLKELESEKLSGEEEAPLDAEEVQKLINRGS